MQPETILPEALDILRRSVEPCTNGKAHSREDAALEQTPVDLAQMVADVDRYIRRFVVLPAAA